MTEVTVRKGEPIDKALKRLKSKLDAEGIMDEVRRLRAFETPVQRSRRKARANAKRNKFRFRYNGPTSASQQAAANETAEGASATAAEE
jgi:small subunit ribosomal protein S21